MRHREPERYLPHLSDGFKARDENTIWCGGLAPVGIESKEELAEAFQRFGNVTHVHIQDAKKFAFVHFEDQEAAKAAVGAESVSINGHDIQVKAASKSDPQEQEDEAGSEVEAPEFADGIDAEPDLQSEKGDKGGGKGGKEMCGDFKRGRCRRGDKCKFSHGDAFGIEAVADETDAAGEDLEAGTRQETNVQDEWDPATADLSIQALRVACIHFLESVGRPESLHELGGDKLIQEHKRELPSLSFSDFIRAFPDNFGMEDRGNGQFLITLLSSAYDDDIDMATVEHLRQKASAAKSRSDMRRDVKRQIQTRKETGIRMRSVRSKLSRMTRRKGPLGDSKAVVVSDLSDGWIPRTDRTVWVGHVPNSIRSKHDVADCFQSQFGPVNHIHVQDDRAWGFVHFEHARDAQRAVDLGFVEMFGRRVDVKSADDRSSGGAPVGGGGGGGAFAAASGGRRHSAGGIRVPDLPHRSGAPLAPSPAVVPRRPEMYRRDPLPPPQYPAHGGGGSYYAPGLPPAGPPPPLALRQPPGRQARSAQPVPQPQSRRPTMDSLQRRPAFRGPGGGRGGGRGGPPRPAAAAFPATASRAAAAPRPSPRPSMAPHLEGRGDAKRRRLA